MYAKGKGVPEDDREAVKWTRKAAEQGGASAQNNLGVMCQNGEGVPKDYVKAYAWWIFAAAQGEEDAIEAKDLLRKIMTAEQVALPSKWPRHRSSPPSCSSASKPRKLRGASPLLPIKASMSTRWNSRCWGVCQTSRKCGTGQLEASFWRGSDPKFPL